MGNEGNHPQMAFNQISELIKFTQIYPLISIDFFFPQTGCPHSGVLTVAVKAGA
jgi:hypothetical protein